MIERKGVKDLEWDTTAATLVGGHKPPLVDKGKQALRPQPSNLTTASDRRMRPSGVPWNL